MAVPLILFWLLLFLGRDEMGLKGIGIAIGIWLALLVLFALLGISPLVFIAVQALIDIVLVIVVFGGDVSWR